MENIHLFWKYVFHKIMDISELSTSEMIHIIATYNLMASGKKTTQDDLIKRGFTEEQIKALNKNASYVPVTSLGFQFTEPLSNFNYPRMDYVLGLFDKFEKGILPFEGPLADQPAQIMEIFNLLSALRFEQQSNHEKKLKAHGRQYQNKPKYR